jgi:hypothetical protein
MPWVTLLIVHGLLAFLLLGAVTHQAVSVAWPSPRKRVFVESFAAVRSPFYANAIATLFVITFLFGSLIYAYYRTDVRVPLELVGQKVPVGLFEVKEHALAFAFCLLPTYWLFWKRVPASQQSQVRAALTVLLTLAVWYAFIGGHLVNNARGFV